MRIFSAAKPLSRAAARNCLLVNQFATPGLGSLMGRRFVAGLVQLALALAGFGCMVGWFIETCLKAYRSFSDTPAPETNLPLGWGAAILFTSAWLLAWITSLSLMRQARGTEAPRPPIIGVPPKIGS
jgi:hypothetical protein